MRSGRAFLWTDVNYTFGLTQIEQPVILSLKEILALSSFITPLILHGLTGRWDFLHGPRLPSPITYHIICFHLQLAVEHEWLSKLSSAGELTTQPYIPLFINFRRLPFSQYYTREDLEEANLSFLQLQYDGRLIINTTQVRRQLTSDAAPTPPFVFYRAHDGSILKQSMRLQHYVASTRGPLNRHLLE